MLQMEHIAKKAKGEALGMSLANYLSAATAVQLDCPL